MKLNDIIIDVYYKKDDRVVVEMYDWYLTTQNKIRLSGKILNYVHNPKGYNLLLDEPIQFYGILPLPVRMYKKDIYGKEISEKEIGFCGKNGSYFSNIIFVREWMIVDTLNKEMSLIDNVFEDMSINNIALERIRDFFSNLFFRSIESIRLTDQKTHFFKYFKEDGSIEILTSDRDVRKQLGKDADLRLIPKVPHFYGFTSNNSITSMSKTWENSQLHFTDNRYCTIDFHEGCEWGDVQKLHAIYPIKGSIICGVVSRRHHDKPPSFDRWFSCSKQFLFLWRLIVHKNWPLPITNLTDEQIVEKLIIPENLNNYYIRHENPQSRYIYAAIFLLIVRNQKTLNSGWDLPKKFDPIRKINVPFEEWWLQKFK